MQVVLTQEEYLNLKNQLPAETDLSKYVKKEQVERAFFDFVQKIYSRTTYDLQDPWQSTKQDAKREMMEPIVRKFMDELNKKETV